MRERTGELTDDVRQKRTVASTKATAGRRSGRERHTRKVLAEEDYIAAVSAIMKRDFFPGLARLEAQYDYLTAMERADLAGLREAAARLASLHSSKGDRDAGREGAPAPDCSLDEFQARYITEDNASFEELLEKLNSIKREKFLRFFGDANGRARIIDDPGRQLLLLSDAAVDRDRLDPLANSTRTVVFKNTRLNRQSSAHPDGNALNDPTDITRHYWQMVKEHGTEDHDRELSVTSAGVPSQAGGADHYNFVPVTPRIIPGVDATPQMTWGQIASTPLCIADDADTRQRRFKVPNTPAREQLGHSISGAMRKGAIASKTPLRRNDLLKSPAVRRLLQSQTPKIGSAFDLPRTPKRPKSG